jgi:hypothetical protein
MSFRQKLGAHVIEICVRLGLALLLSLSLALLLAWGGDQSDPLPSTERMLVEASTHTEQPH